MRKSTPPSEQELDEQIKKLAEAIETNTIRWSGTHCPICRTQLKLPQPSGKHKNVLLRSAPGAMFGLAMGYCLECGLSPREVAEEDVSKWVWVQMPGRLDIPGLSGQRITRVQGATLREVLDVLERQHPKFARFKQDMITGENKLHHFVRIFVNNADVSEQQNLDTPVQAGDYVVIRSP